MFNKILNYKKEDSLIRDSFVLFIATFFANVVAFFYHFYMGRVLGPVDYGILGVVLSLVYIITVPYNVIQTTIAKFTAGHKVKKQNKEIHSLFFTSLIKFFIFGLILTFLFIIINSFIAEFLKIPTSILLVFSPIIVLALLLPVVRGILQGEQSFKNLGINIIIESVTKLLTGIILVYLGLKVFGAVAAIVISFFIAFFLLFSKLKKAFSKPKEKYDMKTLYKYALPVFFALLLLTLFYTVDVFLVKHYFSDLEAGYYAALSLIGKTIFFASVAVTTVMFPKVAELAARKMSSKKILYKSLFFVSLIGIFAIICFYFLSDLVVLILLGSAYISISPYLWLFGVIMLFFSLTYMLTFYNLSLSRKSFIIILLILFIAETFAISLYHSSIITIVYELILLNLISFILMLIYTLRKNGKT